MPGLVFGINKGKAPSTISRPAPKRKNLFDDDGSDDETRGNANKPSTTKNAFDPDDSDDNPRPKKSPKLSSNALKATASTQKYTNLAALHSARKQDAAASDLDASVYDYDGVYESFHAAKSSESNGANGKASGPKYMTSLMQSAEVRKRDQLRAKEKLLQKERENEGDEFADKEKFVTGAYKAQQEEVKRLEEEERKREEEEEQRRRAGGGMSGFYKEVLRKDEERMKVIEEAALKPSVVETEAGEVKTDEQIAAELMEKGAKIMVNDDGEIVDKRQLLSAGLNVAKKAKPVTTTDENSSDRPKATEYVRSTAARNARESQRERQTRMMAAQIEEMTAKQREQEEQEEREGVAKTKSSKTAADISSAKERYLARKREREEEAKKAKEAGAGG